MIINNNIPALNSNVQLSFRETATAKTMAALSSGKRINTASDDASGLAVSEKMRSQMRGLRQATRNTQDGVSFIQTTEGYLQETQEVLQRIRELAVQSANGIYTTTDRMLIQVEVSQLVDEINRVASQAQFNTLNMLTGRFAYANGVSTPTASMWFQIGANMDERTRVYIGTMTSRALGVQSLEGEIISLSSTDRANRAIGVLDDAIIKVSKERANLGAYQNRLETTAKGLMIAFENTTASESRIRDANIAEESVANAKNLILTQANIAMLAQANTLPQGVLALIQ